MTKNATFWTFDHETMRVLAQLRDDMGGNVSFRNRAKRHPGSETDRDGLAKTRFLYLSFRGRPFWHGMLQPHVINLYYCCG